MNEADTVQILQTHTPAGRLSAAEVRVILAKLTEIGVLLPAVTVAQAPASAATPRVDPNMVTTYSAAGNVADVT